MRWEHQRVSASAGQYIIAPKETDRLTRRQPPSKISGAEGEGAEERTL